MLDWSHHNSLTAIDLGHSARMLSSVAPNNNSTVPRRCRSVSTLSSPKRGAASGTWPWHVQASAGLQQLHGLSRASRAMYTVERHGLEHVPKHLQNPRVVADLQNVDSFVKVRVVLKAERFHRGSPFFDCPSVPERNLEEKYIAAHHKKMDMSARARCNPPAKKLQQTGYGKAGSVYI